MSQQQPWQWHIEWLTNVQINQCRTHCLCLYGGLLIRSVRVPVWALANIENWNIWGVLTTATFTFFTFIHLFIYLFISTYYLSIYLFIYLSLCLYVLKVGCPTWVLNRVGSRVINSAAAALTWPALECFAFSSRLVDPIETLQPIRL